MRCVGKYADEMTAARAYDAELRRLDGPNAHGARRSNLGPPRLLNFATEAEKARFQARELARLDVGPLRSQYRGLTRAPGSQKWSVSIGIPSTRQKEHIGSFRDEVEAANAYDAAARRQRGVDAHGGHWRQRLNFPTATEVARLAARETKEQLRVAAASRKAAAQKPSATAANQMSSSSEYFGVSWRKETGKWRVKTKTAGYFLDEGEAAVAWDNEMRWIHGADAHGARDNAGRWRLLNFPTEAEEQRNIARHDAEQAQVLELQRRIHNIGVSCRALAAKSGAHVCWYAAISCQDWIRHLGKFPDELSAAKAYDAAARRLRGTAAHGGKPQGCGRWKLNFPTAKEKARRVSQHRRLAKSRMAAEAADSERQTRPPSMQHNYSLHLPADRNGW